MDKLFLLCRNSNEISHRELMEGKATWTKFSPVSPTIQGEAPKCPVCGQYTGGIPWLPPYSVELEFENTEAGDISFGSGDGILVSKRFRDEWQKANLVGLSSFDPVTIKRVKRSVKKHPLIIPEYFWAKIIQSEAVVDVVKSGLVMMEPPTCQVCMVPGGPIVRTARICLTENSLVSEDIFHPKVLRGRILVTQRFVNWADKCGFLNVVVVPAENASFDHYGGKPLSELVKVKK